MTPDTSLHASNVHEFLSAVPYLLGFHPADSLVVVGFRDRRTLATLRAPLGEPPDRAIEILLRQGADQAVVIGYGEAARVTPDVLRMSELVRGSGIPVVDEFRVTDGRFWSYRCRDLDCCPIEGKPYRAQDTECAAMATYAGQVALPDHAALAARVAAVTGEERVRMSVATELAQTRLAEAPPAGLRRTGRAAVRAAEVRYRGGRRLTDDEVAWLGLVLVEPRLRDYAWSRTAGETWRIDLWQDVTRRVDPLYVPAPASLLGFTAWRRGDGALANVALERALAAEPSYSMAHLIGDVIDAGMSPSEIEAALRRGAAAPSQAESSGAEEAATARHQARDAVPRRAKRRGTGPRCPGLRAQGRLVS